MTTLTAAQPHHGRSCCESFSRNEIQPEQKASPQDFGQPGRKGSPHESRWSGEKALGRKQLSARGVHQKLCQALHELHEAEGKAVIWLAELRHRGLYRELGYGSIYEYAEKELQFSLRKTGYFIQLAKAMDTMPRLKASLSQGKTSWTKAREVVLVATPRTESKWVALAEDSSRKDLKRAVERAKQQAKVVKSTCEHGLQKGTSLFAVPQDAENSEDNHVGATPCAAGAGAERTHRAAGTGQTDIKLKYGEGGAVDPCGMEIPEAKISVSLSMEFSAAEYADYAAMLEMLQKRHPGATRQTIIMQALTMFLHADCEALGRPAVERGIRSREVWRIPSQGDGDGDEGHGKRGVVCGISRGGGRSVYQVLVKQCPECSKGSVLTPEGPKQISPHELRAIFCDATMQDSQGRNRATIPPSLRRRVLARDRYHCTVAGCTHTQFLNVHHTKPRARGGENSMENLATLCSSCHKWVHEREKL